MINNALYVYSASDAELHTVPAEGGAWVQVDLEYKDGERPPPLSGDFGFVLLAHHGALYLFTGNDKRPGALFKLTLGASGHNGVWERVEPAEGSAPVPSALEVHDGVVVNDALVFVGQNDGKFLLPPSRFDVGLRTWAAVPAIGSIALRRDFTILTQGNVLSLTGGLNNKGKPVTKVASIGPLDPRSDCLIGTPMAAGGTEFVWVKCHEHLDIKNEGMLCVKSREPSGDYHTAIGTEMHGGSFTWALKLGGWRNSSFGIVTADTAWDCQPKDRNCKSLFALYTGGSWYHYKNGSQVTSGSIGNNTTGMVVGFVFDMDEGQLQVFYNGKLQCTVNGIDCSEPMHPFVCLDYIPEQAEFVDFEG